MPKKLKKYQAKNSQVKNGNRVTRWMTDQEYKNHADSLNAGRRNTDPGFYITPDSIYNNISKGFYITPENNNPNKPKRRVFSEDGAIEYFKKGGNTKKTSIVKKTSKKKK